MTSPENILICCNYIDDYIYSLRHLTYRNSAASNKLLGLSETINSGEIASALLSLGRGPSKKQSQYFRQLNLQRGEVFLHVLPYISVPVLTHFFSACALCWAAHRLKTKGSVFLFYNYQIHYLPAILYCRLLGIKSYMIVDDDIPDLAHATSITLIPLLAKKCLSCVYDLLTGDKVMTSYKLFRNNKCRKKVFTYYTSTKSVQVINRNTYNARRLRFLFSGTLSEDSGLHLFVDLMRLINENISIASQVEFYITGNFNIQYVRSLLRSINDVKIIILPNLSRHQYSELIKNCDVGLSLKLPGTTYGMYTFPSKVFDYVSNGLAVISTDISDVKDIFGDSVIFVENSQVPYAFQLYNHLVEIVSNPDILALYSASSQNIVATKFSQQWLGQRLSKFFSVV
jgi:glycosyltransferase involved in cell wall biosynthesis